MKMNKIFFFCLFLLTFPGLFASTDSLKTVSGRDFFEIQSMEPKLKGLQIVHKHGISTIPYSDLPPNLREHYKKEEKENREKLRKIEEKNKIRIENRRIIQRQNFELKKIRREFDYLEVVNKSASGIVVKYTYEGRAVAITPGRIIDGGLHTVYYFIDGVKDKLIGETLKNSVLYSIGEEKFMLSKNRCLMLKKFTFDRRKALDYIHSSRKDLKVSER